MKFLCQVRVPLINEAFGMHSNAYFLLFALLPFLFFSCSSDEEALFNMTIEADFDVPAGLNSIETHFFIIRDVPTRITSFLSSNSTAADQIDRIVPNRAQLTGRFSPLDYRLVDRVSVWARSKTDADLRREVFFMDVVPPNQDGDLDLFSSISDVTDILLDDTFDLEIRLTFRTITAARMESRIEMSFSAFPVN